MRDHALRTYAYLTSSRALVLDKVRACTPAQLVQPFPIGPGSLRAALIHTAISEWYYIQRILQREVPDYADWPVRDDTPLAFPELETLWTKQADATRAALAAITDWHAPFEYRVTTDAGIPQIVTTSAADLFTQLAFHEVHHRAQVLNMLRHLGHTIDRDIDFNAMMYPRRNA